MTQKDEVVFPGSQAGESFPELIPSEFLEDCQGRRLSYLTNPQSSFTTQRVRWATRAYRLVSGQEVPEERDPWDA